MKLLTLDLKNFKGLTYQLDTRGGSDVRIYGANDAGKTRISDAWFWLLFGKDSQNQGNFQVKTLDSGEPIHGLEHTVQAQLRLADGEKLKLAKVYKEKWTKKQGSAHKTLTGHTTEHYINDVPVKKTDYEAKIAQVVDEDIFRLLSDPHYFNEVLHWQDRREILLEVCGGVSDEEVLAAGNGELSGLRDILDKRSVEEHRRVVSEQQKEIEKELDQIPVRISETQRSLPDVEGVDVQDRREKLQAKQQELSRLQSGGEVAEKKKRLREVESDLLEIKNDHQELVGEKIQDKQAEIRELQDQIERLQGQNRNLQDWLKEARGRLSSMEDKREKLRQRWHKVNERQFEPKDGEQETTCPTCGQELPEEQVDAAREKALADFNREKAEDLEEIGAEGVQLKEKIDTMQETVTANEAEVAANEERVSYLSAQLADRQAELENIKGQTQDLKDTGEYQAKLQEKKALEQDIENLQDGNLEALQQIQQDISQHEQAISDLREQLAQVERYEQGQKRIAELKDREKELAAEYEKLERELDMLKRYTQTKVRLLEQKISDQFEVADFRLFEEQMSGGLRETCETLYGGVPYRNLDGSAPLKVGLDIINTLSDYYGYTVPVFIDNAERITELPETRGQLVALVVSPQDSELRLEVQELEKIAQGVADNGQN